MPLVNITLPSDGTSADVADYNVPLQAILAAINGQLDDDNIASLSGTKITDETLSSDALDADAKKGWFALGDTPDTVTNNGNGSYDLVFNSTDLTDTISTGMRLRTTRTVSAPTQCADLESSSSQYLSKSSPNGITFVDDFTCMGWVKLESYHNGEIVTRFSTTGWLFRVDNSGKFQLSAVGGQTDYIRSYQSLPLNEWVHVAADIDMSGQTGNMYINGVSVSYEYSNGTSTSLTQAGNLVIGGYGSVTNPFDGKLAQVAVFDAVLSQATIRQHMTQGLSGSETNCVGAWSLDDDITDLTANGNDLTASGGALATNADSPFTLDDEGVPTGTTDYGIVTKTAFSTNTTLTVQVPEGNTIPTSGGVSAVAYSTQAVPFGFPRDEGKWEIVSLSNYSSTVTAGNETPGLDMLIPIGSWRIDAQVHAQVVRAGGTGVTAQMGISSAKTSYSELSSVTYDYGSASAQPFGASFKPITNYSLTISSATTYYVVLGGTVTSITLQPQSSTPTSLIFHLHKARFSLL